MKHKNLKRLLTAIDVMAWILFVVSGIFFFLVIFFGPEILFGGGEGLSAQLALLEKAILVFLPSGLWVLYSSLRKSKVNKDERGERDESRES